MGVPAFFRWLSRKYPSVIVPCIEEKPQEVDGQEVPVDSSQPNPNRIEFDNLYLDMNGIIHPCTHPEDKPAPKDEEEMMVAIFEAIDRLFRIVRPRKLLYMAIDGVAPRAKMNQQRSRRFRASKEIVEKVEEINRLRSELSARGAHLPPEKPKESHFDSNCITPGTPFMARLSTCLHYYIHSRLNTDPGWRGIKVILSDANVPGEGEHKIMDYIRKQRSQPDHDPNTQHCLCGADADLIMLGLATHEPNFTIIREEFKPNKPRPCEICGQAGHEMKDCIGLPSQDSITPQAVGCADEFIFVRLSILREYLERELDMPNLPFEYDFERAVDDWVFMCFFVGNDFLPHLPSLEIREGAIDRLVNLYKKTVYKTGGYITDSGDVNLDRVQLIMSDLGTVEDEIFKKRQQSELSFRAREKAKKKRMRMSSERPSFLPQGQFAPQALGRRQQVDPISNPRQEAFAMRRQGMHSDTRDGRQLASIDAQKGLASLIEPLGNKRKSDQNIEDEDEPEPQDEVRLWEDGFKDRYYESKFDVDQNNLEFRFRVALEYVRGLCWVLRYYYQGCASWKWYFPYHYAPFASDFIDISSLSTEFEKGTVPFRPLEQLMGVFPAASSSHVPQPWAKLMHDPNSPIIDFYPEDFKIDLNGKKWAWQGVALLPFVEEKRLFKALEDYYPLLTSAEIKRNIRGDDRLYVMPGNKHGFQLLSGLYQNESPPTDEVEICIDGMRGAVLSSSDYTPMEGVLDSPINYLPKVENNQVVCVRYRDPKYPDTFIFPAKRLKGAIKPDIVLKPSDLSGADSQNWRVQIGMGRATNRAYLSTPGHRILGHYSGSNRHSQGQTHGQQNAYNTVAPPSISTLVNYASQAHGSGNYNQRYNNRGNYSGNSNYQYNRNQGHYQSSSNNASPHNNYGSQTRRGTGNHYHQHQYNQSKYTNRSHFPHNPSQTASNNVMLHNSQMRDPDTNFQRQSNRGKYTGQSRPYNPQQRRPNRSN